MNFSNNDLRLHRPSEIAHVTSCEVLCPNLDVAVREEGKNVIKCDAQDKKIISIDIDKDKMSKREHIPMWNLIGDFCDICSVDKNDLEYTEKVEHRIHTTTDIPMKQPDGRIPPNIIPEVKKTVENWMKAGAIQERESLAYPSRMV